MLSTWYRGSLPFFTVMVRRYAGNMAIRTDVECDKVSKCQHAMITRLFTYLQLARI